MFIVEDNICRLLINVKPERKLNKDLLPIVLRPALPLQSIYVKAVI
jgi:hypothetical protein